MKMLQRGKSFCWVHYGVVESIITSRVRDNSFIVRLAVSILTIVSTWWSKRESGSIAPLLSPFDSAPSISASSWSMMQNPFTARSWILSYFLREVFNFFIYCGVGKSGRSRGGHNPETEVQILYPLWSKSTWLKPFLGSSNSEGPN